MSSIAEDLPPASVVARSILDIAAISSQQLRDDCLRVSGAHSVTELSNNLERSLLLFFQRNTRKQRLEDTMNHCVNDHSRIYPSTSFGNHFYSRGIYESSLQTNFCDFSSADEDDLSGLPTPADVRKLDFRRFNGTPAGHHLDTSGFSPEQFSPSSPFVHENAQFRADEDDFSQDESESPSMQIVPLIQKFPTSPELSQEQFATNSKCSFATTRSVTQTEEYREVDEFSE